MEDFSLHSFGEENNFKSYRKVDLTKLSLDVGKKMSMTNHLHHLKAGDLSVFVKRIRRPAMQAL